MTAGLGIDFGTSNTVIARWDDVLEQGVPFSLPDYGHWVQVGSEEIPVVPSLIHYAPGGQHWIGNQVLERNLSDSPRTFRWMKRYIANRSPLAIKLDGRQITPFEAGQSFLSNVLLTAGTEIEALAEEVGVTVPVEAFEHYEDWLSSVLEESGLPRFRLIDEPSAAALGYGAAIQPGDVYLIVDFGGGTFHASMVLVQEEQQDASGRRCRVLGKAGMDLGGMTIDGWMFAAVLKANRRNDDEQDVRLMSNALLAECERAKMRLSFQEEAEISVVHPHSGAALAATFTRESFEALLDEHQAFTAIDRTIRRALNQARERGYGDEHIKAVLMVGGSSQIPSVGRLVRRIFGRERVSLDRPLDAVARGAAAFVAGVDFFDHIQHDYGIRYFDRAQGKHDYRLVVPRGTPYPSDGPVAKMIVKAAFDGQEQMGIAIFELSNGRGTQDETAVELIFDPSGAARLTTVTPDEAAQRTHFWMNENQPTFLKADPAANAGEARFEVHFSVDLNKKLRMTARDLVTGSTLYHDYPVVKLT